MNISEFMILNGINLTETSDLQLVSKNNNKILFNTKNKRYYNTRNNSWVKQVKVSTRTPLDSEEQIPNEIITKSIADNTKVTTPVRCIVDMATTYYTLDGINIDMFVGDMRERVAYFIYLLSLNRKQYSHFKEEERKKILGYRHKKIIDHLIYIKIIERTTESVMKDQEHADADKYRYQSYRLVDCNIECVTACKLRYCNVIKSILSWHLNNVDVALYEIMVSMSHITIDIDQETHYRIAMSKFGDYINNKKAAATSGDSKQAIEAQNWLYNYPSEEDRLSIYTESVNNQWDMIDNWNKMPRAGRILSISTDQFGRRVHHLLTYTNSWLRAYLKYGKKIMPVVSVDLKQSQVTLLSEVLCLFGCDNNKLTLAINSGSDIYEILMKKHGIKDRNIAKPILFQLLYGCRTVKGAKYCDAVELVGENGVEIINDIKGMTWNELRSEMNRLLGSKHKKLHQWIFNKEPADKNYSKHKNLACLLQRIESYLYRQVVRQLTRKKIKHVLVHDGLYVEEKKTKKAKDINEICLSKFFTHTKFQLTTEPVNRHQSER